MPFRFPSAAKSGLWLVVLFVAACGTPRPTVTPTPIVIERSQITPATLPPTWTPAPTRTAVSSFTPLPTLTPFSTQTAAQVCETFKLTGFPNPDEPYPFEADASFIWENVPYQATILVQVYLENTQSGIRLEIPQGGDGAFTFSLLRLPQAGTYQWRFVINDPRYAEICPQTGTFRRAASLFTPVLTPPTLTITPSGTLTTTP
ncbi:MAG: hypothetical protein OHK0023_25420 [Anaerolineae bacterium]